MIAVKLESNFLVELLNVPISLFRARSLQPMVGDLPSTLPTDDGFSNLRRKRTHEGESKR